MTPLTTAYLGMDATVGGGDLRGEGSTATGYCRDAKSRNHRGQSSRAGNRSVLPVFSGDVSPPRALESALSWWSADCRKVSMMLFRSRTCGEASDCKPSRLNALPHRLSDRPSGRHGGPCALPVGWSHDGHELALKATYDYYIAPEGYAATLNRTRRSLSHHGVEILRECNIGSRVRHELSVEPVQCRILYVAQPGLIASGISTHPSAALWLPLPVVLSDAGARSEIFLPVEAIISDRASLLGIRKQVQEFYRAVTASLEAFAERLDVAFPA